MDKITNEQLCIAAQSGDKWAENALVENNLRFIRKTAYEIWSAQRELNVALGIELNDLVQEGSLGLLGCISSFQPDYGNKFLTYAAPAIHNAMLDYIRRLNPTFEAKNLDCIIRLDEVKKGENKGQHEFIADSRVQNPEQIFIAKETHEEIHTALEMIDEREKAYPKSVLDLWCNCSDGDVSYRAGSSAAPGCRKKQLQIFGSAKNGSGREGPAYFGSKTAWCLVWDADHSGNRCSNYCDWLFSSKCFC